MRQGANAGPAPDATTGEDSQACPVPLPCTFQRDPVRGPVARQLAQR